MLDRRIHSHVKSGNQNHTRDQGYRNIFLWALDFFAYHVEVIPAIVGPKGGDQGGHESRNTASRPGKGGAEVAPGS